MNIAKNSVVSILYKLTDSDGTVIDSNDPKSPLAFIHGLGNILPALEKKLEGKAVGDKINAVLTPEEGYGKYSEDLIVQVPKSQFAEFKDLQEGMEFFLEGKDQKQPHLFVVQKIEAEHVILNGNHPLADKTLNFDIEVAEIREATKDELAHGHVHGPGGHQH